MSITGVDGGPLANVTTQQLGYLVAVSRAETMAAAAKDLHISPSALSQGLSELERRLGVPLFERQGRTKVLTSQGREAVDHAERILSATRELTLWVEGTRTGERGRVRLGLIDIAAVHYFPDTLVQYRMARPDIDLQLSIGPSANLTRQLLDGQLDAAVIVPPPASQPGRRPATPGPDQSDLELVELLTEELAIYLPGPIAGRPPIRVGKPEGWGPWVTFPPESHTRRHIARALTELGAEFRVEAESHQPEILRQLVNLGMGWTVLPVVQAESEPNPLIRARKRPLLRRRLVVARRAGSTPDAATAELVERMLATAATMPRA